jgi:hypothetical protein
LLDIKDQRQLRFAFPENPNEPGLEIEDEIDEIVEESSAEDTAWAIADMRNRWTTSGVALLRRRPLLAPN